MVGSFASDSGNPEGPMVITVGKPFDSEVSWVAPVALGSGMPAVLKIGMPHFEGESERHGMLFWNGEPTARVIDADERTDALLLERCIPGTPLSAVPEEQ